jgi:hypothetical protein
MSRAHVHDYCGKNFEDLTNILNQLPYADMIAYIEKCIDARKQDFDFHEKMDMIGHLKTDLNYEQTQDKTKQSSGYIKNLKNAIEYYQMKRDSHVKVIETLEERLTQIQKYYKKHGYKPVLKQDKIHSLFNPPSEKQKELSLASFIRPQNVKRNKTKSNKKQGNNLFPLKKSSTKTNKTHPSKPSL